MDPRPYHYQYRKPRLQNPTFQSNRLYQSIYHLGSFGKMYPNKDNANNNPSSSQNRLGFKINPQPRYNQQSNGKNGRSNSQIQKNYAGNEPNYPNKNGAYIQNYVNGSIQARDVYPSPNLNNYESNRYQNQLQRKKNVYNNERQVPSNNMRYSNDLRQNTQMRHAPQDYTKQNQRAQYLQDNNKNGTNSQRQSSQGRSYSQEDSHKNLRQSQQKQGNYMSNYGSRLIRAMPGADQDFVYQRQQKPYNIISCYPKDMYGAHRVYPKLTLQSKLIETGQYHSGGYQNPEKY